jgi:hypothetical protein
MIASDSKCRILTQFTLYDVVDMTRNRRRIRQGLLIWVCAILGACASGGETRQLEVIDPKEIAKAAGCAHDEVAVCIEIDCQPYEYRCAARSDVLKLFKAGEFRY